MAANAERKWRRRRFCLWCGIIAACLLVVCSHGFWWGKISAWRAGQLLSECRDHVESEHWEEAERTARASLALARSTRGLRLLMQAQRAQDDPHRLQTGILLFRQVDASLDDRAAVVEMALDVRDYIVAARLFGMLGSQAHANPALHYQKVRFHLGLGDWNLAIALADAGDRDEQSRSKLDLLLVRGLVQSGRIEIRPEVSRRLEAVMERPDEEAVLLVMRELVAMPDDWIPTTVVEQVVKRAGALKGLGANDELGLSLLKAGLPGEDRARIVQETIQRHAARDLPALVDWLGRLREWNHVLALTETVRFEGRAGVVMFGKRADALRALGHYERLEHELDHPPAGLPQALLQASRACVHQMRGRHAEALANWQDALASAKRDRTTNHFYRLALLARQSGMDDWEMEALAEAIEHPLGSPPPVQQLNALIAWLYKNNDIGRLLSLSYRLLLREPNNPTLLNNFHYLHALHQQPRPDALPALQGLVERFPQERAFRGSLAFLHVQLGDPAAALATLGRLEVEAIDLEPVAKVVYCAALRALDRREEADRLARSIDWSEIPGGERNLLRHQLALEKVIHNR